MGGSYDNTNRGALFTNARKTSDKHPDYTGELDVNGKKFRLAGWKKQSKEGKTFLSLSVSPAEEGKGGRGGAPSSDDF